MLTFKLKIGYIFLPVWAATKYNVLTFGRLYKHRFYLLKFFEDDFSKQLLLEEVKEHFLLLAADHFSLWELLLFSATMSNGCVNARNFLGILIFYDNFCLTPILT